LGTTKKKDSNADQILGGKKNGGGDERKHMLCESEVTMIIWNRKPSSKGRRGDKSVGRKTRLAPTVPTSSPVLYAGNPKKKKRKNFWELW